MPLERIYMNEAGQHLAIKSSKALIKWCDANSIKVYIERGRKFLCRIEFLSAVEKPFIQSLKRQYGANWKEVYEIMESNDTASLVDYQDNNSDSTASKSKYAPVYKPKSPTAKSFLAKILKD